MVFIKIVSTDIIDLSIKRKSELDSKFKEI